MGLAVEERMEAEDIAITSLVKFWQKNPDYFNPKDAGYQQPIFWFFILIHK